MKQSLSKKGKNVAIQIYRIVSMFLIIMCHICNESSYHLIVQFGQVFNVGVFCILMGKMAFIGPRPWITDYYNNMNYIQRHRCDVLPGITGLAQAKGRNNITIFEKINYDLEYIDNYSLIEDIKVIWWTIETVLSKAGADAGKSTIQNELNDLKTQEIKLDEIVKGA